jgi:hypothetical protein
MILTRYKILIACAPFPFEATIVATNETAAIAKARHEGRGLKLGRKVLEIIEDSRFEMHNPNEKGG